MPPKTKKSERNVASSSDTGSDHCELIGEEGKKTDRERGKGEREKKKKKKKKGCDLIGEEVKDYFGSLEFRNLFQASLSDAITKQMTELRDRLEKAEGIILTLENVVREKTAAIDHLQEKQSHIIEDIRTIHRELNDAEQYSRRNCVRLYGISEQLQEDTDALTLDLAKKELKLGLRPDDIDRLHRVGPPHQPLTGEGEPPPPRPIIVKFTSYRARNLMIRNRRLLRGKRKGIEEDLTAANRLLLKEAKKEVERNEKLNAAWSSDGRIIVLIKATNGKTIRKRIHYGPAYKQNTASLGS